MKVLKLKVKDGNRKRMLLAVRLKIPIQFVRLAFFGVALSVNAQSYSIDWHKIAGGGGTSSGGAYQMDGTVGQPDAASAISCGNYSLTGGYWSLISVVQTPGMPPLFISPSGNTVTVYWQNVTGCTLQENGTCIASAGWTACPCSPSTANGTNYVSITCSGGSMFFRLCKQ
ncbi:MAG TPA: hypothetical protein VNV43_07215 [Candidatus Acidoferrales bacterium]|jgi:hypothetical protein|nr:hypothetical protein [Candidatus Acidoferrales bacterium]